MVTVLPVIKFILLPGVWRHLGEQYRVPFSVIHPQRSLFHREASGIERFDGIFKILIRMD